MNKIRLFPLTKMQSKICHYFASKNLYSLRAIQQDNQSVNIMSSSKIIYKKNEIYADRKSNYLFTSNSLLKSDKFRFGTIKFPLPDLGQKIKEGKIRSLYVKQGDKVQQFQKIADVQSDKQFTQITSPESGVISKLYYKENQVCNVGDIFLELTITGPNIVKPKPVYTPPPVHHEDLHIHQSIPRLDHIYGDHILMSPAVLVMAKQKNVDLNKVRGTGPKGRILKQDVINYVQDPDRYSITEKQKKKLKEKTNLEVEKSSTPRQTVKAPNKIVEAANRTQISVGYGTQTKVKMSSFEIGMKKSMTQSNQIPHLYLHQQIDITQAQTMRKALKESNVKITLMSILVKTFSLALNKHPRLNSTYDYSKNQFQFQTYGSHNVSIAIDSPNGLVVPNIKNVNKLNLLQIQKEIERLRNLAQQARLTRQDLQNGTICLSNIGTIGGVAACPLILPPQVCIVAIGKAMDQQRNYMDKISKRKTITLSFGCDHRIVDGASVARFCLDWRKVLEQPYLLMQQMI